MKQILTLLALSAFQFGFGQCTNSLNTGTPNGTSACYDFDAIPSISGSSTCVGSGFGGGGTYRIIQFCTNASASCVVLDISGLAGSNGTDVALYTTCTGANTLSGYVAGSAGCYSNSTDAVFSTANITLSPNTCYYARFWTKTPPTSSATVCAYTQAPANDFCANAMPVSAIVQQTDNYCMTAAVAGDPSPAQYCAGSLENNAWYTFVADPFCSNPCDVVVTFSSINCNGGASGFQIGYWTGSCGSLSYLGCTSGSGGTVTATITTTPGQTIMMGLDGNAGAFCEFGISASNTMPLPVGLFDFYHKYLSQGIELNWSTVTEKDNDYFTIERSSDGENFVKIGTVQGVGNSTSMTNYKLVDDRPAFGLNYYRLSQTDLDGTQTELKTIVVESNSMFEGLSISPNPVNGDASIHFISKSEEETTIEIMNVSGILIHSSKHHVKNGSNTYLFNSDSLPRGAYFLRVSNASETKEIKFLK